MKHNEGIANHAIPIDGSYTKIYETGYRFLRSHAYKLRCASGEVGVRGGTMTVQRRRGHIRDLRFGGLPRLAAIGGVSE